MVRLRKGRQSQTSVNFLPQMLYNQFMSCLTIREHSDTFCLSSLQMNAQIYSSCLVLSLVPTRLPFDVNGS